MQTAAERGAWCSCYGSAQARCCWTRSIPGARQARRHLGHRSRHRCCHRPWTVAGSPCHGRLSLWLQPASPAPTSSPLRSLSVNTTKTLVKAFISCHLDNCNSLLYGINDWVLRRLQSVQNAASLLATGFCRCDHITPVLRPLYWLPVRQRVVFKIAGLVHRSLGGAAPAYLADDCRLLSDVGRRPLRSNSNDMRKLLVPRWSFTAAGPRLWNDLPPGLRRPIALDML